MTLLRVALRTIALVAGACCLSWLGGLLWFATPPTRETRAAATDAIVVLTGGSLRLQSGIDLLREGEGRKLFVSGVNQQVDLDDLLGVSGRAPDWALCCIVLGHEADDTFGNAQETAQWIRSQLDRADRAKMEMPEAQFDQWSAGIRPSSCRALASWRPVGGATSSVSSHCWTTRRPILDADDTTYVPRARC